MVSTSYFANLRNIEHPVSVSRYQPAWYEGPRVTMLAPSPALLSAYKAGGMSESEYTSIYTEETLDRFDQGQLYNWIISKYSDSATLLCYERPGQFCHRRLLASWLETRLGIVVPELPGRSAGQISGNLFAESQITPRTGSRK